MIPGDFNIDLYHNGKYIICKNNTLLSRLVSNDAKNYHQSCRIFASEQIINSPTCVSCKNTSLIDHILPSIPSRISHHFVIKLSVSDHQENIIYCPRKYYKNIREGVHTCLKSTLLMLIKMPRRKSIYQTTNYLIT